MENRMDLSKLERDDLRNLLSKARDEWVKYTKCKEEVEKCEKYLEEEKKVVGPSQTRRYLLVIGVIMVIVCAVCAVMGYNVITILAILSFIVIFDIVSFYRIKYREKDAQKKIAKYEPQLLELQQKEEKAKNELNRIFNIPFKYWDEYALATMLQSIEDFEASNWERATDLYKEGEYRRIMMENSQLSLEEARRQTEILLQTRNAARVAAFGSLVSAAGILGINSKL